MFYSSMGKFFLKGEWHNITVYADAFGDTTTFYAGTLNNTIAIGKSNTKDMTLKIMVDPSIPTISNVKTTDLIEWVKNMHRNYKII